MARKTSRDITTDLKKTAADARMQLMAVVGATDLAAERVREASEKARQTAKEFKIKDLQKDLGRRSAGSTRPRRTCSSARARHSRRSRTPRTTPSARA